MQADTTILAVFELDINTLTINTNPVNYGNITGRGSYPCGSTNPIIAEPSDTCFVFSHWSHLNGDTISEDFSSSILILTDTTIIAVFRYVCIDLEPTLFEISAPTISSVDPVSANYQIPITLSPDLDVPFATILRLVLNVDKRVFYPKGVSRGDFDLQFFGNTAEVTISNIELPAIQKDTKTNLCYLIGDIILTDMEYTDIIFKEALFTQIVYTSPKEFLIDGSLSIQICNTGSNRYLLSLDNKPGVIVESNPAQNHLKVLCRCIEKGKYTLTISDFLGITTKIYE
jgi:hypothetical protein